MWMDNVKIFFYLQVQQKWQKLLIKYKEVKKNKATTGQGPKSFEFYDDMDIELGDRPDIKPVIVIGSDVTKSGSIVKIESNKNLGEGTSDTSETPRKRRKKQEIEKEDPIAKLQSSLDNFISHAKQQDEQKNAFMREYLDMFAKANNIKKD